MTRITSSYRKFFLYKLGDDDNLFKFIILVALMKRIPV